MRPAVIGVGNPWRSDDGLGPHVVEQLRHRGLDSHADLLVLDGEATRIVDAWSGRPTVVVIDAICTGNTPGTVTRIDTAERDLPTASGTSSHGAGLAEAVALGAALGRLPQRLVLFGVEPESMDDGSSLSAPVATAVPAVIDAVTAEVVSCA